MYDCEDCLYEGRDAFDEPCKSCIAPLIDNKKNCWKPKEETKAADAEEPEEKKSVVEKLIKLEKRPEMLAIPVPIYEHTDSEIPEKVRISFTNGTSYIYTQQVTQPAPQLITCIEIIRKWEHDAKHERRRNRRHQR